MTQVISLKNIKVNNLNIPKLELELGKFHVFCGPSGSGKSSLAFDFLYSEAERKGKANGVFRSFRKSSRSGEISGLPGHVIGIEQQLTPRSLTVNVAWLLSWNEAQSKPICSECNGHGYYHYWNPNRIIQHPEESILKAFTPAVKRCAELNQSWLKKLARDFPQVNFQRPWNELPEAIRKLVMYGGELAGNPFDGIITRLAATKTATKDNILVEELPYYFVPCACHLCSGTGLALDGANLNINATIDSLDWNQQETRWIKRLNLGTLKLYDPVYELSSSVTRKLRFFAAIRTAIHPSLIIYDEPAAGMVSAEAKEMGRFLRDLQKEGHTIIAVEHRMEVISQADIITVFGPGSGSKGGKIVFQGNWEAYSKFSERSNSHPLASVQLTSRGKKNEHIQWLTGKFSSWYGFKDLEIKFPLGKVICVTGPSGSGKTAFLDAAYALCDKSHVAWQGRVNLISRSGQDLMRRPYRVDASPIGISPASTPATYVQLWGKIRSLFAALPEAKSLHLNESNFSFNTNAGRCPVCKGCGYIATDGEHFIECDACSGTRYKSLSLKPILMNKNIAQINAMTFEDATQFFASIDLPKNARLAAQLSYFGNVALDYLVLGQPSSTLSGGESLRVKLINLLSAKRGERSLYIMDNPCRGIGKEATFLLGNALRSLTPRYSVLVAENDPDFLPFADYVITLDDPKQGKMIISESKSEYFT